MSDNAHANQGWWLHLCAGASLGLFLGLIIGLSFSPVVAAVVTALTTVVAGWSVLFVKKGESKADSAATIRLIGFAIVATVTLVVGIYMRTHNTLSPSFESTVSAWEKRGFSTDEAKALVMWQEIGGDPLGKLFIHQKAAFESLGFGEKQARDLAVRQALGATQTAVKPGSTPDPSDTGLFNVAGVTELNPANYAAPADVLIVYSTVAEPWPTFAASLEGLDEDRQNEILAAVWKLLTAPNQ